MAADTLSLHLLGSFRLLYRGEVSRASVRRAFGSRCGALPVLLAGALAAWDAGRSDIAIESTPAAPCIWRRR